MKKNGKILKTALPVLFIAFIIAGAVLYLLLPKKEYSSAEKRYLAGAPEISMRNIGSGKFSSDFESFLADQTPFRTFFVSVNAYFELLKGNNGSGGVYLGKDGFLIEKPFESENRFEKNTAQILEFSKNAGLPVTLIAVPEKGSVLSGYLPRGALKYEDSDYIDSLGQKCEKTDNLTFVNLVPAFSGKENTAYYYKTDHHWTSDGAFAAYKEICRAKDFAPPAESDYDISEHGGFYGTSYSTSCYTLTKPDTVRLYDSETISGSSVTITEGKKVTEHSGLLFRENLEKDDLYTVFIDGNHTRVDIDTHEGGKKLLVIKDSFAHCLVPFLTRDYGHITMIDQRYFMMNIKALTASEKFDEVMFIYGVDTLAESRDIVL